MDVFQAIRDRASTRAFQDRPVPKEVIHQVLDTARWAPSGVNTQPWHVAVATGSTKKKISDALLEAHHSGQQSTPDYKYYADPFPRRYRARQVACGAALYGALGIQRDDKQARVNQWLKNFVVELFFFVEDTLEKGSWLDMGMFIQNVMLAVRGHGLETCPQFSMAEYPDIVRSILELPDSLLLICGLAVGYADRDDPVNNYRTEREPVEKFAQWFE